MIKKLIQKDVHPFDGKPIGLFEYNGEFYFRLCTSCVLFKTGGCSQRPCGMTKLTNWQYINERGIAIDTKTKIKF